MLILEILKKKKKKRHRKRWFHLWIYFRRSNPQINSNYSHNLNWRLYVSEIYPKRLSTSGGIHFHLQPSPGWNSQLLFTSHFFSHGSHGDSFKNTNLIMPLSCTKPSKRFLQHLEGNPNPPTGLSWSPPPPFSPR